MQKRIALLLHFPIATAISNDAGFSWDIPEKTQQNAHTKCLRTIASELKVLYKKKFPLEFIDFSVRQTLDTINQQVNTTLLVESDSCSFSDENWGLLANEVKEKLKGLFEEVNVAATMQTDTPIKLQIRNKNQTSLPFEDTELGDNVIFVDSSMEKKILEEIIKVARTQTDTSYNVSDQYSTSVFLSGSSVNFHH